MTVHFTSDLHFGHRLVSGLRGFATTEDHDDAICDNWVDLVRKDDVVWVLGDLTVSRAEYALTRLAALPGTKHLVLGNHDRGHPMHRGAHRWQRTYLDVFDSAQPFARRRVEGRQVLISHFPYEGDTDGRDEDRLAQYRLPDHGLALIHGHTHSAARLTFTARATPQVHVGLDAWGLRPVTLETVGQMLGEMVTD